MGRLKIANAKELEPILKSTKLVNDKRTISEQLSDQIICGNEKRYHLYRELRAPGEKLSKEQYQAMEYFMKPWISLETILGRLTLKNNPKARGTFNAVSYTHLDVYKRQVPYRSAALSHSPPDFPHGISVP